MKTKKQRIPSLTTDEQGKLQGGFSSINIQPKKEIKNDLGATNVNCQPGGWFDSNRNCYCDDRCGGMTIKPIG